MRARHVLTFVLAAVVTGVVAPGGAGAHDGRDEPVAVTGAARDVTATSAVLTGTVTPEDKPTHYAFEYGTTTAYGRSTPAAFVGGGEDEDEDDDDGEDDPVAVAAPIAGLLPATAYHFRLVAAERRRVAAGRDMTFTTGALAPVAPVLPAPASPVPAPAAAPPAAPVLGSQIVVAPVAGVVRVRPPAMPNSGRLAAAEAVPVGTLLDTRAGTARVTTAVDRSGRTQSVDVRDGLVEIRQAARSGGTTELRMRGGSFAGCGGRASRAPAAVVARRRRPHRTLWAHDRHGRFRTRGRNSVATVRGTTWRTTDTCRGTTTSVTSGSVVVRNLRTGRRVVVRAGRHYLARSRR